MKYREVVLSVASIIEIFLSKKKIGMMMIGRLYRVICSL